MKIRFQALLVIAACLVSNSTAHAGEGHEAGRRWAERRGIDDPDDCLSVNRGRWANENINNSPSFTEGCMEHLRDEGITNDDDELAEDEIESDDDDSYS